MGKNIQNTQIKSKQRVHDHAEVFTAKKEVTSMLNLVKNEIENIESTFLEPACGDGNFLSEILTYKLNIVKKRYSSDQNNFEKYSITALSSLYGVEILPDNVQICISRLFNIWNLLYDQLFKQNVNKKCKEAAMFILQKNILCGDALTLKDLNNNPIIFSEWKFVIGSLIKRREYRLDEILSSQDGQISLMWILDGWQYDEKLKSYIPKPIKEYDVVELRDLAYGK